MIGTMQELFDRTGKRYQVNGAWYRDDTYGETVLTIRVLDKNDISDPPLRPDQRCEFCNAGALHSEGLHHENIWGE